MKISNSLLQPIQWAESETAKTQHVVPLTALRHFAVEVAGLRKSYGKIENRTDALVGVDLQVDQGEIVGILGPNGAGKTTLISILEGLIFADAGTAQVLGQHINQPGALRSVKHLLGVAMQRSVLPPLLHAGELLERIRALYPRSRDPAELIERLGLETKRTTQIRHLSGGQQQRLSVALALVGDPELVFLDEPTSQLDPQARRAVWDLLLEQRNRRSAAILLTTHQMEEAERLCDKVAILDQGKILAAGPPRQLIERYCPARRIEFLTQHDVERTIFGPDAVVREAAPGYLHVQLMPKNLEQTLVDLMTRKGRGELVVDELRIDSQNLEDVFIKLTGRGIRQ